MIFYLTNRFVFLEATMESCSLQKNSKIFNHKLKPIVSQEKIITGISNPC